MIRGGKLPLRVEKSLLGLELDSLKKSWCKKPTVIVSGNLEFKLAVKIAMALNL